MTQLNSSKQLKRPHCCDCFCLCLSLRYDKSKYHMKDVIIGKVSGSGGWRPWKLRKVDKDLKSGSTISTLLHDKII